MEKFLGVLFCGGRGTRLGEITKYISKSLIPIYKKPVFQFGLELLENSNTIDEILILTNDENNDKFKPTGYKTIVQDDNVVFDMFSGWEYIKKVTGTKKNGVLLPSDNISNIDIEILVKKFIKEKVDIIFSLFEVNEPEKLKQMGCYSIEEKKFYYKSKKPKTKYGVIAPYIVKNSVDTSKGDEIFNMYKCDYNYHKGYWFDIGDYTSIVKTNLFVSKQHVQI
jgi:dTDP-glucose pyrophosphorylase